MSSPLIAKGSTILVTGANGFIASHVTDQLLAAGYNVRGTARSKEKLSWVYDYFDNKYGQGRFSSVIVPDMTKEGAFDEAVRGVSGICHVASVVSFSNKYEEVVPITVQGALGILESARKEPGIKSVVYTSSSTAALLPVPNKKIVLTADTWNDAAIAEAQKPDPNPYTVYAASKTAAEKALWEAVQKSKPSFQFSTILPDTTFGQILQPGPEGLKNSSTAGFVVRLANGDDSVGWDAPQWTDDVVDIGRLHVAALIDSAANGKRLFAWAEPFNRNSVLAVLRKHFPDREFLPDRPDMGVDLSEPPNEEAEALLKKWYNKGWTRLEQSVLENCKGVI